MRELPTRRRAPTGRRRAGEPPRRAGRARKPPTGPSS